MVHAKRFLLTQDDQSTNIWLRKTVGYAMGRWKSERPGFDFRDTGEHDQFFWWRIFGETVLLYNDIGLREAAGAGHVIGPVDESRALAMWGVPLDHLVGGKEGVAAIYFPHSHVFNPGRAKWEYTGQELVDWPMMTD